MKSVNSDGVEWEQAVADLDSLAGDDPGHRGRLVDEGHFGNRTYSIDKEGIPIRLVFDRGTIFIDLYDGNHWHSLRNISGFMWGWPAAEVSNMMQFNTAALLRDWPSVVRALRDPKLIAFENEIADVVIADLAARAVDISLQPSADSKAA